MRAGLCHKGVIPAAPENPGPEGTCLRGFCMVVATRTPHEAAVPTLFRFLFVVAVLAGLGFGAMIALAYLVEPEPREITVPIPSNRIPSSS